MIARTSSHIAPFCFALMLGCGGTQAAGATQETTPEKATNPPPSAASGAPQSAPDTTAATAAIAQAVANPERSEQNRARDAYRHPTETLSFFGVEPTQRVVELWPGRGWYTEVLAPLLREHGVLYAAAPKGSGGEGIEQYRTFLAARPQLFDRVHVVELNPPSDLKLGEDNSVDRVLTFRNFHNWVAGDYAEQLQAAIFRVLAPGGVYGVVEHRAKPGTTLEESKKSGYMTEDAVIALVTKAGFVLEARSEINANPRDTKDYPEGVWNLPPSLHSKDVDRDKYLAIGESDRMTLRFRKPAK